MTARNISRGVELAARVRVADGHASRLCGLLATPRQQVEAGVGLWLVPCRGVHMMGMRYAIDALYLDRELRVIHIEERLRPWRAGAVRREAWGVLEVAAGTVARTGTAVGDRVEWRPGAEVPLH